MLKINYLLKQIIRNWCFISLSLRPYIKKNIQLFFFVANLAAEPISFSFTLELISFWGRIVGELYSEKNFDSGKKTKLRVTSYFHSSFS